MIMQNMSIPARPRFLPAANGNIAMIFAMSLFVLGGAVGVAIDFGRASNARGQLQSSLDSAVLSVARLKANGNEDPELSVRSLVQASFGERFPSVSFDINETIDASGSVRATASAAIPTKFMQLFGKTTMAVSTRSAAQFGAGVAEVALVLDNTFSMSGAKIAALKDGAKRLVDIIYEAPDADKTVRVGLVPFARYVNVGVGYRGESWLDVEDDSSSTANQCWQTYPNATSSNCHTVTVHGVNDGLPYSYDQEQCDWDYGAPVEVCGPVTTNKTWNGCVGSRGYPLETKISDDFSTPVPGIMDVSCSRPLTRLSNDKNTIKDQIDAMVASDETFLQAGIIWGWRLLSPQAPFSDGANRKTQPDVKRFMVLMTDGANTISPSYPKHDGNDTGLTNALSLETCNAIKAEGTYIYAIAFDVTDPGIRTLLSDCATAPPYYYAADDAAGLKQAFEAIANSVVAIRLTQ
jgi:Flp pilus assembly protein TadG